MVSFKLQAGLTFLVIVDLILKINADNIGIE